MCGGRENLSCTIMVHTLHFPLFLPLLFRARARPLCSDRLVSPFRFKMLRTKTSTCVCLYSFSALADPVHVSVCHPTGDNPIRQSYVVGYNPSGTNPADRPHHRSSSCIPNLQVFCGYDAYNNPVRVQIAHCTDCHSHILQGAALRTSLWASCSGSVLHT